MLTSPFEDSLSRAGSALAKLSQPSLPLSEALAAFSDGCEALAVAKSLLTTAEGRVAELSLELDSGDKAATAKPKKARRPRAQE